MRLLQHNFRRFLDALDELSPALIQHAYTKFQEIRQMTAARSETEARTIQEHRCPF